MVDRTPVIATLLRQKPAAAEGRIQGIGRHNATEAALDVLRDRMEALRRDQNALRERMAVSSTINPWVPMRACARVALVLMIMSASFGLAACGAIDDLGGTVSRWFDVGSPGRPGSADALPHATPMIPPELGFGLFRRRERVHFPFGSRYGAEFLYCLGLAGT